MALIGPSLMMQVYSTILNQGHHLNVVVVLFILRRTEIDQNKILTKTTASRKGEPEFVVLTFIR